MADFVIRRAGLADAETVQRISAEAYVPAYRAVIEAVPKPASENYRPRIENGEVWILETAQRAVGVLVLQFQADFLLVYSIAVRPGQQRRGYATALLAFTDEIAIAARLPEVRLYTNRRMVRNISLYRRCGFREIGERQHPSRPGEILVDFAKVPAARPPAGR